MEIFKNFDFGQIFKQISILKFRKFSLFSKIFRNFDLSQIFDKNAISVKISMNFDFFRKSIFGKILENFHFF